ILIRSCRTPLMVWLGQPSDCWPSHRRSGRAGATSTANISPSVTCTSLLIPHKDQSNLNRFITDPKWDYRTLNKRRVELVEDELDIRSSMAEVEPRYGLSMESS
ncbi:MAG: hypothetical protein ACRECH_18405, partial [Nitrososphaerales archaeon]